MFAHCHADKGDEIKGSKGVGLSLILVVIITSIDWWKCYFVSMYVQDDNPNFTHDWSLRCLVNVHSNLSMWKKRGIKSAYTELAADIWIWYDMMCSFPQLFGIGHLAICMFVYEFVCLFVLNAYSVQVNIC